MEKIATAALKPVRPGATLVAEVIDRIAAEIAAGRFAPGARLPTEQELSTALGVSRTVIREAVAALRAKGLVVTRQGAGAFVAEEPELQRRYTIDHQGLGSLAKVIEVLELRLAVEVEAAALASTRGSKEQIATIAQAQKVFRQAMRSGEQAVREDFAFHQAIAAATGNGRILELVELMGRLLIPRHSIHMFEGDLERQRRYLSQIETEHAAIFSAIKGHEPERASLAMREHLSRSLLRYRELASEDGYKR